LVVPAAFVQESIMSVVKFIRQFVRDEEGVTAIEYGLIATLVAIAIIVGAGALGTTLNDVFQGIADTLVVPG
jgi:pilus assembly protein Flp/PilA